MIPTETFLWGFGGSWAVEIVTLYQAFNTNPVFIPDRYKRFGFWVTRLLLAIVGGGLAVAYDIDKRILAANVGAATPALIFALAQGLRPPTPPTTED